MRILLLCLCTAAVLADNRTDMNNIDKTRILPAETIQINAEPLKLSPTPPQTWNSQTVLHAVQCMKPGLGTPVPGALVPSSVKIYNGTALLAPEKDYLINEEWGTLGLAPNSSVTTDDKLTVDYQVSLRRIDSLVQDPNGQKSILQGTPHLTIPQPPLLTENQIRLANIFVDHNRKGPDALILPIKEPASACKTNSTPNRIPKTLEKIKAGKPVKIVCWGDSVTHGGETPESDRYATVLTQKLKEKFPDSQITVEVIAVGGSSSIQWLDPNNYPNPGCDFNRVLSAAPDLVTIEFVNDTGLYSDPAPFNKQYNDILTRLNNINAETILITPHFTIGMPPENENRQYVKNLISFADQNNIALADASSRWQHLYLEGLPYETLLINNINHPDARGHIIFAEEIMKCFK